MKITICSTPILLRCLLNLQREEAAQLDVAGLGYVLQCSSGAAERSRPLRLQVCTRVLASMIFVITFLTSPLLCCPFAIFKDARNCPVSSIEACRQAQPAPNVVRMQTVTIAL
jgi:hypothetical protein